WATGIRRHRHRPGGLSPHRGSPWRWYHRQEQTRHGHHVLCYSAGKAIAENRTGLMSSNSQNIILMADDDADDRLLVKDALAECQIAGRLHFVEDGEELMDYLLRQGKYSPPDAAPRPGLVLLDLNMPRKDGREALREIRAHPELRRLPVVAFTTSKSDTDVSVIYDLGANSFVSKPVAFAALVSVLRELTRYWFGIVELPEARSKGT